MFLVNALFQLVLFVLIASCATGLIMGGPDRAKKILSWELKKLAQIGRWFLKLVFETLADVFLWLAKQCGPPKKKKP